jgi:hypothetical protein
MFMWKPRRFFFTNSNLLLLEGTLAPPPLFYICSLSSVSNPRQLCSSPFTVLCAQFCSYFHVSFRISESTHATSLFALLKNDHQITFPPGSFFHDLSRHYLYSPSCYLMVMIKTRPGGFGLSTSFAMRKS